MLSNARVAPTLAVTDLERARRFYEGTLGLESEVAELRSRGVEIDDIVTLLSGVKQAFFTDPDGNIIGMRQLNPD